MSYHPDAWRIIKITADGKVHYRVFAGWYGGFAGADSWKMNSGITKVVDMGKYYNIYGESGSCYSCSKSAERMNMYMRSVISEFISHNDSKQFIELMDFDAFYEEFTNVEQL